MPQGGRGVLLKTLQCIPADPGLHWKPVLSIRESSTDWICTGIFSTACISTIAFLIINICSKTPAWAARATLLKRRLSCSIVCFWGWLCRWRMGYPPGERIWLQGAPFIHLNRLPKAWQHQNGHYWMSSGASAPQACKAKITLVGLLAWTLTALLRKGTRRRRAR